MGFVIVKLLFLEHFLLELLDWHVTT